MAFFGLKSKSRIGIDIGTSSIKVVELSKDSGRFKMENYGMFVLEAGDEAVSVSSQAAHKPAQLSDTDLAWGIKEVLKRSKIETREAVASIPSFSTFSTVITMPYISEKDMAKTINFEARKYVPIPLSDVVLDWSIINIANNTLTALGSQQATNGSRPPSVEVFLVAVPKQEVQRYQNIMKQAGVSLRALELENSALIRALIGNDLSPVAIVNIGGRSTSILIVDSGFERVSHNYEVGGFEITKSISRALNISLQRAEELKRSMGVGQQDNNIIKQATGSLLDMMAFEAKKTIHNYEDLKKIKISKVFLVGGLANMPNFTGYFTEKTGLEVTLGNPLARVVVPPALDRLRSEINSTFAIATGLAMREV